MERAIELSHHHVWFLLTLIPGYVPTTIVVAIIFIIITIMIIVMNVIIIVGSTREIVAMTWSTVVASRSFRSLSARGEERSIKYGGAVQASPDKSSLSSLDHRTPAKLSVPSGP